MKKFVFIFLALLVTTEAFAGGQQTLVNGNGVPIGTPSNPIYVSGGGGQAEDSSVIFNVKTEYGAKGDGVSLYDGTIATGTDDFSSASASFTTSDVGKVITIINAGAMTGVTTRTDGAVSASSTAFTAAGASFTSADVKKLISIAGAGPAGGTLYTRISAYVSGTSVTLLDAASTTVSGASFSYGNPQDLTTTISAYVSPTAVTLGTNALNTVNGVNYTYGTDDTDAIQDAVDAVFASNPPSGTVFFPAGIYIINGPFTAGSNTSQIGLPDIPLSDDSADEEATIVFEGPINQKNPNTYRWGNTGAILYSTRNGSAGTEYIISGKSPSSTGDLTDIYVQIKNLTFRTVQNPTNSGIGMQTVNSCLGENIIVDTAGLRNNEFAKPTGTTSYGIRTCGELNNNMNNWSRIRTRGFYNGIFAGEHTTIDYAFVLKSVNGIVFPSMTHASLIGYIGLEQNVNNIVCTGGAQITIEMADIEHNSTDNWWTTALDISDASHNCTGEINYDITGTGGATTNLLQSGGNKISKNSLTTRESVTQGIVNTTLTNSSTASATSGAALYLSQDNGSAATSGSRTSLIRATASNGVETSFGRSNLNIIAGIYAFTSQDMTSSHGGGEWSILTTPNNSTTPVERMRISQAGDVGIGNTAPAGRFVVSPPASEAIAGAATITANACGTIKQISSTGNVTTNTTDTFTAPAAANTGCCMDVINVDTADTITLDQNAKFLSAGGADVALGPNDTARVCSNGTSWFQIGATGNN